MFQVGELVVYGNSGVCRVEKIGEPDLSGAAKGVDYYTLSPYYQGNSKIFTPCDNTRIVMRPIMTRKEAQKLFKDIDSIELLVIDDERKREECYKNVMKSCDCRQFISIIKTINARKKARIAEGKKITTNDEKYFHMAEDKLIGELAISLNVEKEDVKERLDKELSDDEPVKKPSSRTSKKKK